jgi:hypothetical protein
MKTLAKILGIGMLGLALVGCGDKSIICESPVIHERVKVLEKRYIPAEDELGSGIAIGLCMKNLPIGIALGSAMSRDEEYLIKFRGEKIDLSVKNKAIYERFNSNNVVDVSYKEICRFNYTKNKDGKYELASKKVLDYKVIDAQPIK